MLSIILRIIRSNGLEATERQCFYVLKYYDKDQNCKLSFKEFIPILLPLNNTELRDKVISRNPYEVKSPCKLPTDIEYPLAKLLYKEIEMHEKIEKFKEELLSRDDFNILKAFKSIDAHHTHFIDFENLEGFFKKKKQAFLPDDITAFIRRIDRDLDCKVSYMEFMEGICPTEPKVKPSILFQTPNKKNYKSSAFTSAQKKAININKNAYTTPQKFIEKTVEFKKLESDNSPIQTKKNILKSPLKPILKKTEDQTQKSIAREIEIIAEDKPEDIFELMWKQLECEKELERLKQNISIKPEITLQNIHSLFFAPQKDFIVPSDFQEGLAKVGVKANLSDVYMILHKMGKKGKLQPKDINELFLPYQAEYLALLKNRYANDKKEYKDLTAEGQLLIKQLLQKHIEIERVNKKLKQNSTFHPKIAFEKCDIKDQGYFTKENIEMLFKNNNKDKDGKVNFFEFINEIQTIT